MAAGAFRNRPQWNTLILKKELAFCFSLHAQNFRLRAQADVSLQRERQWRPVTSEKRSGRRDSPIASFSLASACRYAIAQRPDHWAAGPAAHGVYWCRSRGHVSGLARLKHYPNLVLLQEQVFLALGKKTSGLAGPWHS